MARRSMQNPRYRKDNLGKTRKSAASAKPKRAAGEKGTGSRPSAKKETTTSTRPSGWRGFFAPLPTPDTPEFKRWRKIWAGFFVAGVVFTAFSLFQWETRIGVWSLVAAYTCLFSAIFIDITKVRRMRRAYADELEGKPAKGKDSAKQVAEKKDSKKDTQKDSAENDSKKGDA